MNAMISSIICTHNRADYLRSAIKSLIDQTLPQEKYEIIVVDNASSDDTRNVVSAFKGASNLRYVYEEKLGLAHARNTGWREAMGLYVAYLDDDALASEQWLEKILEVFETVKPKPGCLTGRIDPIWEVPQPVWLSDSQLGYLAILNWSDAPLILKKNQWLGGANMSFPKRLLEKVNGFNPNLGRMGRKLRSGEDILLQRQVMSKGYNCLYHPGIIVQHHIPASRLDKGWIVKRAFWQGVSDAFIQIYEESPSTLWRLRKGLTALLRILFSPRELVSLIIKTDDPNCMKLKCSVWARIATVLTLWGFVK